MNSPALFYLSLLLTAIGAIGSIPIFVFIYQWITFKGTNISGTWNVEWKGKDNVRHEHTTEIKQKGKKVKMFAHNEWKDIFNGEIYGRHITGEWDTDPQVNNFGVFMMEIKGRNFDIMEGVFIGLDDNGVQIDFMNCKMTKCKK